MKDYRNRTLAYYGVLFVVAVALLIAGIVLKMSFLCGFGTALGFAILINGIILLARTRGEDAKEEYNASVTDERVVFITRRARSAAFVYSLWLEALGCVILNIMGNPAGLWLCYVICAQAVVYAICYFAFRAKS